VQQDLDPMNELETHTFNIFKLSAPLKVDNNSSLGHVTTKIVLHMVEKSN